MARRTRFITWCRKDPNDETPINYTFKTSDKEILNFSSEDVVSFSTMERIRNAWIENIQLVNGVWNVTIYED